MIMVDAIWNPFAISNAPYQSYTIEVHHSTKIKMKKISKYQIAGVESEKQYLEEVYLTKARQNLQTTVEFTNYAQQ